MAGRDLFADEPLDAAPIAASRGRDLFADEPLAPQDGALSPDGLKSVRPDGTSVPTEAGANAAMGGEPVKESKLKIPEYSLRREGLIRGLIDPITAGAQMLTAALPESANQAITSGDQWLAANTGGVLGSPAASHQDAVRAEEQAYQAQRATTDDTGMDGDRIAGNIIASAIPATKLTKGLQVLGAGAKTAGAITGGLVGAFTPTEGDDFLKEKAMQVGAGAAGGFLLPAAGQTLASIAMPKAAQNQALQKVLAEGGKPTIGMALGGRANALEEKLTSLPIVGDMINIARGKAVQSLEPAAFNRALTPIGEKLPKGVSGRDAIIYTENALKSKYDDVLTKIGAITPDEQFSTKTQELAKTIEDIKMPQAQKDKFLMALDDVTSSINKDGVMTSQAYKELESNLGSISRKLGGSQDIYEGKMAPAVKQLQAELRGMLERQAGPHAKELKAANTGWANFKVVQKAAGGVGAEEGKFSPAQLQSAVRAADKSKDKGAYARGGALMQDLSEAGKTVMGNKTGNSFTADRGFMGLGALSAGYAVNPAIPVGLAGGAAMYTQPVQRALVNAVANRGKGVLAPKIAAALNESSNYLISPSATGGALLAQ